MTRGVLVNDVHSRLNPTRVREVVPVASLGALVDAVRGARGRGLPVCVAGGRHAMGGQAFADGGVLIDVRGLDRIGRLDPVAATIEVEAGIQWPALIEGLARHGILSCYRPVPWRTPLPEHPRELSRDRAPHRA